MTIHPEHLPHLDRLRPYYSAPMLVLGDDPVLDLWEWLKFDRKKCTSKRKEAICLTDDKLPPSPAARLRVMRALTALGVVLGTWKPGKGDTP